MLVHSLDSLAKIGLFGAFQFAEAGALPSHRA